MKAFTRLGLHEKFLSAGFLKKYGGEIMGACSDTGTKFYFKDGYRSQTDHAYQVTRGDFDKVLLDHARLDPRVEHAVLRDDRHGRAFSIR